MANLSRRRVGPRGTGVRGQANRFSSRQNVNDAIIAAIKWSNDSNNNNHNKQQQKPTAKKAKHTQQVRIPASASIAPISHPEPLTPPLPHTSLALLPCSIEVLPPINLILSPTPTPSHCSTARATKRCKSCPISITISIPFPLSFPSAALAPPPSLTISSSIKVGRCCFFLYLPVGFHFQLASASATTSSLAFCASLPAHSLTAPSPTPSSSLFSLFL